MKQQSTFRKWAGIVTLGYVGGTVFLLMYVRYVFYAQMIETMGISNAQLGWLNTVCMILGFITVLPGAYMSDKFDAKKVIVFTIGGVTVVTFLYAAFVTSYTIAIIVWGSMAFITMAYWGCLVKYINNLGGEGESGKSFGTYYFINGLSGVAGNAIPLWAYSHFNSFRAVIITQGIMTLIATIMAVVFLDDEKKLASRGVYLRGDDPITLKHIPHVLKWPGTYIIGFAYLTTYTMYSNVSYFNPYLTNVVGIDPDTSSVYAIIRSYGAMLVAPVGGIMADKVFKSTSTWYIVAFSISAVMFAIPFLFGPDSNPTLVSVYSVLPSFVIFALYSVTYSILRELHIPPAVSGTAIGLCNVFGMPVDGVYPTLFGSWIDNYGNRGFNFIFIFLIINCIFGILNALWAKSHDKKCKAGKRVMD